MALEIAEDTGEAPFPYVKRGRRALSPVGFSFVFTKLTLPAVREMDAGVKENSGAEQNHRASLCLQLEPTASWHIRHWTRVAPADCLATCDRAGVCLKYSLLSLIVAAATYEPSNAFYTFSHLIPTTSL